MVSKNLLRIAERLGRKDAVIGEVKKPEQDDTTLCGFSLEDLTNCWRVSGVNHGNRVYAVDLSKTLLPSQTQDEHAEDRKEAIENNPGEFYTPSYPEFHAIISSLYQNRDNLQFRDRIGQVRTSLKRSASEHWLMTLTRIRYNPHGNDLVIHNYRQQDQYEIPIDFVGPDGAILSANHAQKPVQVLLDTKQSLQEINNTYKWLTDVDSYLWKLNSKPKQMDERIARFLAGSSRADFGCDGGPQGSDPALGVKFYLHKN